MKSNGCSLEVKGANVDFHVILQKAFARGWSFVKIEWKDLIKGRDECAIFATEHGRKRLEKADMIDTTEGFCYGEEDETLLKYFKHADTFLEFVKQLEEIEEKQKIVQTVKITNFC